MCRLSAFPPGFKKDEALEILKDFERSNTDGVGYTYIKDGKFNIRKWPTSLSKVVNRNKNFLVHMDGNQTSWTIVHLRAATHGHNSYENTHPFIVGGWAICHNGVWSDHKIARLVLEKTNKFYGETDSEVAANLINLIGPKKFAEEIDFGGVYLALNADGSLWAVKTSGQLAISQMENGKNILASDFPAGYNTIEALNGWYNFDNNGAYVKHKNKENWSNGFTKYHKTYPGYTGQNFSHIAGATTQAGRQPDSHWYFGGE